MVFKRFFTYTLTIITLISSYCNADCYQSVEFGIGWRSDDLKWQADDIEESSIDATVDSHILFKDIEMYTVHAKAKWIDSEYYIRLSADYGQSYKGRAHEHFFLCSPLVGGGLFADISDPVKRRSEFFDFDGAVGYPLTFCCCRLMIAPMIGFSFHRQRIRVKHEDNCPSCSSSSSLCCFPCGKDHPCSSDNCHLFSSDSDSVNNIACLIGCCPKHLTSNYRFTWYGFYLGTDIAYALDSCWTVFSELEMHLFNRNHCKRDSRTSVDFVDNFHAKEWAWGFNGTVGTTFCMCDCWFSTLAVDFKWWKNHSSHESSLWWKSTCINITLGYIF